MRIDPVELEIFKNIFVSICEEMGAALKRVAYSPNIKERRDYSCAVFDAAGETVAQGDHMPVHLGSMPMSVLSAINEVEFEPGDMVILNDPFHGGTHLPDITLIKPIFLKDEKKPSYFVANRAHHADVGGISPGSMPLSTEIFQEGIIIPPVKLEARGKLNRDLLGVILGNVRTPDEREGDLAAQIAANRIGERRLIEITDKYGRDKLMTVMEELKNYAERITRRAIEEIPDGSYSFVDFMDDDGVGKKPVKIAVRITIKKDEAVIDFSGSSPQVPGSINAVYAITLSAVFYVFRAIVNYDVPSNAGGFRPLRVIAPEGSIVNARGRAAVAGGNVETSQRIVDVLLGALSQAIPDRIPAASSGTMNNISFGGVAPETGEPFAYYETIGGGMGARPGADGISGVHTHMTNSLNTPIEAMEHSFPLRIKSYRLRKGSGGGGSYGGGEGIVREYQFLAGGELSILSERRRFAPYGLCGGLPGRVGRNSLITTRGEISLPSKVNIKVAPGDILKVETPGGGGYGLPE
jgi:N-methylhydantoinase B/oxoprolinase/acetone carboxylase alpha subunit